MTDDNQNTNQTDGDNTNANNSNDGSGATSSNAQVDWEARYKGLQRVQEQKRQQLDQQIADLTQKNEQAIQDFNEKKSAVEAFEKQQATYLQEKGQLEEQLKTAQAELDKTNKKVLFQKIILAEFPDLSDMIDYIPVGETEEDIRKNAEAFKSKVAGHVDKQVKSVIDGSSSPPSSKDDKPPTTNEEDALWKKVYETAGQQGKEEEYQKAYKELQDFLARKSKQ